jgi:integrase
VKGTPESGFAEVDDAKQARRILEAARANRLEALYVLAVTAGLRIGELLGLRWEDIAQMGRHRPRRRNLTRQAHQQVTGQVRPYLHHPKENGKGRSIRLTQRAVEALKSHKAAQATARLKLGDLWENNDLVFCTHSWQAFGLSQRRYGLV